MTRSLSRLQAAAEVEARTWANEAQSLRDSAKRCRKAASRDARLQQAEELIVKAAQIRRDANIIN